MHYGHMNAFRLGGKLGTTLIVGVNSSESIAKCKVCNCRHVCMHVFMRVCVCVCVAKRSTSNEGRSLFNLSLSLPLPLRASLL